MELQTKRLLIREWKDDDIPSLVLYANDPEIGIRMRDGFPFPYTESDAHDFLKIIRMKPPVTVFAVILDGEAIGSIGYFPKENVYRINAEIGYWLGKAHWGNGFATELILALSEWIFSNTETLRLYAQVFEGNIPSARALEKAGYIREATLKKNILKNGVLLDEWLYSRLKNSS